MATNLDAVKHLERLQINNASYIVTRLVEAGFIEEKKLTEPERYAQAAKDWVSADRVFTLASAWTTEGWAVVLNEEIMTLEKRRNIFWALVLLAKEEGIDL